MCARVIRALETLEIGYLGLAEKSSVNEWIGIP